MSVTVQGRVPRKWDDQAADHITRRLQILERALAGGATAFLSPATPTFGPGSITGGAGSGSGGGSGGGGGGTSATDHGALTGLLDDDHPQYVQHGLPDHPAPHQHISADVADLPPFRPPTNVPHAHTVEELGLDSRFYRRGERVLPNPHQHAAEEFSSDFYRRGERVPPAPHDHNVLSPDDAQCVLASRLFGG